jgi:HAD superfamily hydrolase (TIGR01509 family)
MDGVLVDTEPIHLRALTSALEQGGFLLTEQDHEEMLGRTFQDTLAYLTQRFHLEGQLERYARQYDETVLRFLREPLTPAPGVTDLLEAFTRRRVPLALASSSKRRWIDATLNALGAAGYFPWVVSGEDVSKGKPEPDIFLQAAERLGIEPHTALVIEDSPVGITAGRRAGMDVIAVRTPSTEHLPLSEATRVVMSLEEVDADQLSFEISVGTAC